jgi:nucleoside-diphosphate-sugar epimerase
MVKNTTVLVTGGAGAIGSNLVAELVKSNNKVVIIDNLDSGYKHAILNDKNCIFIEGEITDEKILNEAFSYSPTVIFHLAAFFANQRSVDFPERDLEVNGKGTLKLLQFSLKNNVKKFIYASSSCVYGNKEHEMKEEEINLDLETPYAITKLLGEHYVTYFNRMYNLPTVILRYFNSYGPGDFPGKYKGVIPNFIKDAMEGKPLVITGTGEETRAFTYIKDVVDGTIAAAVNEEAVGQVINIGSNREMKIIELAEKIKDFTGSSSKIEFKKRRVWDQIKKRKASLEKAKELLNYHQKYDFDEGLKLTIDWMRDQIKC